MVVRNDVSIFWAQSPRIIRIAAPSTEITIQDLVDTLRFLEQELDALDDDPLLVDATGKEELGGGVKVGITCNLFNAVVYFAGRTTALSSGSFTDVVTTTSLLVSNSFEDFVAKGVIPGATILNTTDDSSATVLDVISPTMLRTTIPTGGATDVWTTGDDYRLWNIIQCNIDGGNLVATDVNGDIISPVLPSAFTQIVRTSSSSATLQELTSIQHASFEGGVTINTDSTYAGTSFPIGTKQRPVNNFTDANLIADLRGFNKFFIQGVLILNGVTCNGRVFEAQEGYQSTLAVLPTSSVTNTEVLGMIVTGTFGDNVNIRRSAVNNISYRSGFLEQCALLGTVMLEGGGDVIMTACIDGDPSAAAPLLDCTDFTGALNIRQFFGGLEIDNKTSPAGFAIDITGRVLLGAGITNGSFFIRGIGNLINNAAPGVTVDASGLLSNNSIASHTWDETLIQHTVIGSAAQALKVIQALSA